MGDGTAGRSPAQSITGVAARSAGADVLALIEKAAKVRNPSRHFPLRVNPEDKVLIRKARHHRLSSLRRTVRTLTYAASRMVGNRDAFVAYARAALAIHPHIKPFLDHYDSMGERNRRRFNLDVIAEESGVPDRALIEAVAGEAFEQGVNVANLIAAQSFPDVVGTSVRVAKTGKGIKDRELLMQHHGFLPLSKGTTVNVQTVTQIRRADDDLAPDFETTVTELSDASRAIEAEVVAPEEPECTTLE